MKQGLLTVGVLAVATALATWGAQPFERVYALRDTAFTAWIMEHIQSSVLDGRPWRLAPIAFPVPDPITQSDWVLGQALLGLPLRGQVDPFVASNLVGVVGLFATAWACAKAAEALLGPGPHTWVAGVVGGLNPVQLVHLNHVNLVHHEWAVGSALALGVGLALDRPGLAGIGGALVAFGFHFGAYAGVHGVACAGAIAGVALFARQGSARAWGAGVAGLLVAGASVVPVAQTWLATASSQGVWQDVGELGRAVWDPATTLGPVKGVVAHRWLGEGTSALDPPNPGYLATALAVVGLVTLRPSTRWPWVALGGLFVVSLLLALGPELTWNGEPTGIRAPYHWLAQLPGGGGLRAPARWLSVAFLALAPFAAAGARELARRWRPAAGLPVLLVLEFPTELGTVPRSALELDPVYAWVADLPAGLVLYDEALLAPRGGRPSAGAGAGCTCTDAHAMRAGLFHGHPTVGGIYARTFDALALLNEVALGWPDGESEELFRAMGVGATIEHPPWRGLPPEGFACSTIERHRVCTLTDSPRSPMPAAVREVGDGPVVGVRFERVEGVTVRVRCGDTAVAVPVAPWRALTWLRDGRSAGHLDLLLAEPCVGSVTTTPRGGVPLYAMEGATWPEVPAQGLRNLAEIQ